MNNTSLLIAGMKYDWTKTNLYIHGNTYAEWIFSYNDIVIGTLFLILISWNVWLTYKFFKIIKIAKEMQE
jgi:hypothetical protein